jgi:hypothetical protein
MDEACVPAEARQAATLIASTAATHELTLGGGTACALRCGHRVSRDLDFFALGELDTSALLSDLASLADARLGGITAAELSAVLGGVEVSATGLGRPPAAATEEWRGVAVLSALDLARLEVEAAVHRGMLRDLCDLYFLCRGGIELADDVDPVVALKALTDPERFAGQPALELRRECSVDAAIGYFEREARRLLG